MSHKNGTLIVFAGLPGSGKTSLARNLARKLNAAYIRIDTIEQAIVEAKVLKDTVEGAGYCVGYGIAEDNLRNGMTVIADSVNPVLLTRRAWREAAKRAGARTLEIEVVCSDREEHRKRVETRVPDIQNHKLPTWEKVLAREYDAWDIKPLTIDTSHRSLEESADDLYKLVQGIKEKTT